MIVGSARADVLLGYAGNDTFFGGGGNDTYNGGSQADTVSYANASSAIQCILFDPNQNLGDAQGDRYTSIENITGSAFADVIYGNTLANVLSGAGGSDRFVGEAGADTFDGGAGADTISYDVSTVGVRVDFLKPTFNDGHAVGDVYISIENLDGSSFNDILYGDNASNLIQGNTYHGIFDVDQDKLFGRGGNDTLRGWAGKDSLEGGAGRDTLTGGADGDNFVYRAISDTGTTATTRDVITDFTHNTTLALSDRIDLTLIDAKAGATINDTFSFIGSGAFTGVAGQLHYRQEKPGDVVNEKTIIEGDINGDKKADFQIELTGLKALVVLDFIL